MITWFSKPLRAYAAISVFGGRLQKEKSIHYHQQMLSKKFYVPMILKQTTIFYADIHVDVADDKAIYGCHSDPLF